MIDRRTFSTMLIAGIATSLFAVQAMRRLNLRSMPAISS
jgi:hypothetical protein